MKLMERWIHSCHRGVILQGCWLVCLSLISSLAVAKQTRETTTFQFDESQIALRGSGCPQGTYSITYTEDQSTMTILFDEFSAQVPQFDGVNENDDEVDGLGETKSNKQDSNLQRRVCTIRLAALIPQGQRLHSMDVDVDYRGAVLLDQGTLARFRTVVVGRGGIIKKNKKRKDVLFKKRWVGKKQGLEDDFFIDVHASSPIKSQCARKKDRRATLVLKNVLTAKIKKKHQNKDRSAAIFLDSADVSGKMTLKFNVTPCKVKQKEA